MILTKRNWQSGVKACHSGELSRYQFSTDKKLNEAGLKSSKDYFKHNQAISDELFILCDFDRINGVGPVAAKAFYEAGYRSVSEAAGADAAVMLEKVSSVNEIRQYDKA